MKKKENWYFTFGSGQAYDGRFVTYFGTMEEARNRMFDSFGDKWSMQYSEKQWNNPTEKSKVFNGFKPTDKVTMAKVWNWREIV